MIPSDIHPYPPISMNGMVSEHDRPYAEYGHLSIIKAEINISLNLSFLGLSTIAKTHKFDLQGSNTIKKRRDKSIRILFSSSSFAFLAKTNIPSKTRVILYFVLCNFSNWIDLDLTLAVPAGVNFDRKIKFLKTS